MKLFPEAVGAVEILMPARSAYTMGDAVSPLHPAAADDDQRRDPKPGPRRARVRESSRRFRDARNDVGLPN